MRNVHKGWWVLLMGCAQTVTGAGAEGPDGGPAGTADSAVAADGATVFVPHRCAAPDPPADCALRVVEIAAGSTVHTCARMSDGTVRCRGNNTRGELGVLGLERSDAAVTVPGLGGVVQVVTGNSFVGGLDGGTTCVRLRDGGVQCWGDNREALMGAAYFGEQRCGDDRGGCARQPVRARIDGVRHLAMGAGAVCAVRDDGSVWCWGRLSPAGGAGDVYPRRLEGVDDAVWIRALGSDWLVRRRDGRYLTAGPTARMPDGWDPALHGSVSDGAVYGHHYCGRSVDGGVLCTGTNVDGALGNGTRDMPASRRYVYVASRSNLEGVRAVVTGNIAACAVRLDGTVWCWGRLVHAEGEVDVGPPCTPGDRVRACVSSPRRVQGLDRVTALALGVGAQWALRDDGTVWAWGSAVSPATQVPRQVVW